MEVYLARGEIRRRVLARMGTVTNDTQSAMHFEKLNEEIRSAAQHVYAECHWASALREHEFTIGVDQRFVNYPTGATAGSIRSVAIWDDASHCFYALMRRWIDVTHDNDQLEREMLDADAAGDTDLVASLSALDESQRARPVYWQGKQQIELWPSADAHYHGKIDYVVTPDLNSDDDVSVVDAELIILWALAEMYDWQGDDAQSEKQLRKFTNRLNRLKAWQNSGESFQRGQGQRERIRGIPSITPNYDTRPSTV